MDMALSLDTAEISEIEEAASWGVLGGVTTNPTLISRAGHADPEIAIKKICSIVDGPVSMECVSTDADGMYREGRVYATWAPNVLDAARAGADIATMPFKVFQMLVKHPLTDRGLADFLADWQKVQDQNAAAAKVQDKLPAR